MLICQLRGRFAPTVAAGWMVVGLSMTVVGCAGSDPPAGLADRLRSEDQSVVARAAAQAGASGDRQTVPYLIDALEHEAGDVRLFAIVSLRRLTGQDLDYRCYAEPSERQAAVGRWRRWWRQEACAQVQYEE